MESQVQVKRFQVKGEVNVLSGFSEPAGHCNDPTQKMPRLS